MTRSRNELESLQLRALQLEDRERALRDALRQRWRSEVTRPARVALALTAASVAVMTARGAPAFTARASTGSGWLRGVTGALELAAAVTSLRGLFNAEHRSQSDARSSHAQS